MILFRRLLSLNRVAEYTDGRCSPTNSHSAQPNYPPQQDIMHVEIPRAVPLVFYLDENLQPVRLAGAAPHLSGEYVGDPEEVGG